MNTYTNAMDFARASANAATDSWHDYGSVANAIRAHHINVIDTLTKDYPAMASYVPDALRAYYSRVATDIARVRRDEERRAAEEAGAR